MATRNGTPGNDALTGTASADSIFGFAGNDNLQGLAGSDRLFGGIGNDQLFDGAGNFSDRLFDGTGNDILFGGIGSDRLNGSDGNDPLTGSSFSLVDQIDTLIGRAGSDLLILGDATKVIYDELIAIVQEITSLSLDGDYFKFTAEFDLADLNGRNGFKINGIDSRDYSGTSVSSAGDVNGDGFDDIIIGAPFATPNAQYNAGESYVVFGSSGGFSPSLNLSTLDGSNGFQINGINERDFSGGSVSSAGDVNGDGFDDILIGASGAAPNGQSNAGESYVVFGSSGGFNPSLNLSTLDGSNGFQINGIDSRDYSGTSVSSAGDVNGDGFDDILIGASNAAPNNQSNAGESYVVFGKAGGFSPSLNLSELNGSNGFQINGIDANDSSGNSVSNAGDVNGDGFDDILIGASGAAPNGQYSAGESYVIFGRADFTAALNVGTLAPFEQLFASNTGNAMMPTGQNLPFGSATTAANIFFDLHNAGISTLLGGTDITQMIT